MYEEKTQNRIDIINAETNEHIEDLRKSQIIKLFSYVGIVALTIFSIKEYFENQIFHTIIISAFIVISIANVVSYNLLNNQRLAGYLILSPLLILMLLLSMFLSEGETGLYWHYSFPLVAFFILGRKQGVFFVIILLLTTFYFFKLPSNWMTIYPEEIHIRYVYTYLLSATIAFIYENIRSNTQNLLKKANKKTSEYLKQVTEKNEEIQEQASMLESAYSRLKKQNNLITDSISYAQTIQNLILPPLNSFNLISDSFIIFKPKDIVSGDFYWYTEFPEENEILVAIVDCTGHGVPGALMTMISHGLLNEIVLQKGIRKPAEIIQELDKGIIKTLRQDYSKNLDGVDIILCNIKLDGNKRTVRYIGAMRPLFYYSRITRTLDIEKGWNRSIGGILGKKEYNFTDKKLELHKGDTIYLFSDGLTDQVNYKNSKLGRRKLQSLLCDIAHFDFEVQKSVIESTLEDYTKNTFQYDDIAFWGIKL